MFVRYGCSTRPSYVDYQGNSLGQAPAVAIGSGTEHPPAASAPRSDAVWRTLLGPATTVCRSAALAQSPRRDAAKGGLKLPIYITYHSQGLVVS